MDMSDVFHLDIIVSGRDVLRQRVNDLFIEMHKSLNHEMNAQVSFRWFKLYLSFDTPYDSVTQPIDNQVIARLIDDEHGG